MTTPTELDVALPHGITLNCRVAGPEGAPVLMFLHGFPEAAFIWDDLLRHFGDRYRCVAPNLRGYGPSSAPEGVEAYRAKHLVADVQALVQAFGGRLAALVAHDWGGAVAWSFAIAHPQLLERLVIVNSPHAGTFLRELLANPAQQAASAYMLDLCAPDAEATLSANGYAAMFQKFDRMGASDATQPGGGWLTEPVKAQLRAIWDAGLTGALNYYRASPLRPPTGPDAPVHKVAFPPEAVTVRVPVHVVWGERDQALLPALLDGLETWVPQLTVSRIPEGTHWVIHEQPQRIAQEIERALSGA